MLPKVWGGGGGHCVSAALCAMGDFYVEVDVLSLLRSGHLHTVALG